MQLPSPPKFELKCPIPAPRRNKRPPELIVDPEQPLDTAIEGSSIPIPIPCENEDQPQSENSFPKSKSPLRKSLISYANDLPKMANLNRPQISHNLKNTKSTEWHRKNESTSKPNYEIVEGERENTQLYALNGFLYMRNQNRPNRVNFM